MHTFLLQRLFLLTTFILNFEKFLFPKYNRTKGCWIRLWTCIIKYLNSSVILEYFSQSPVGLLVVYYHNLLRCFINLSISSVLECTLQPVYVVYWACSVVTLSTVTSHQSSHSKAANLKLYGPMKVSNFGSQSNHLGFILIYLT